MKHELVSRLLSILLSVVLIMVMLPVTAFAAAPGISNAVMDSTNIRVTIDFTEGVYGNAEHTNPVATEDFALTFEQNDGAVSNVTISSVRTTGNGDPVGGETELFFYLILTGGPASGTETIIIGPADGSSVYNGSGEAMAASETTGTIPLNDITPPTFPTGFPKEGSEQAAGSKRLSLQTGGLSEPATLYYVVLADGADPPSALQIKAGQDSAGAPALYSHASENPVISHMTSFSMSGHDTPYEVYFVLEDTTGNQTFVGPLDLRTPPDSVCAIGSTGYGTLDEALEAVTDGQVIKLLANINYDDGITLTNKSITFDLNGFILNVTNSEQWSAGLSVTNGVLSLTGIGELNVVGYSYGVKVEGTSTVTVTSAMGADPNENVDSIGAYVTGDGELTITGSASGARCGAFAENAAIITIGGNAVATAPIPYDSFGAQAQTGGIISVAGTAESADRGIYVCNTGSKITVRNVISNSIASNSSKKAVQVESQGQAFLLGDCTVNASGGTAVFVSSGGEVTVDGTINHNGKYIVIYTDEKNETTDSRTIPTTKLGYHTYSTVNGVVWVKDTTSPPVISPSAGGGYRTPAEQAHITGGPASITSLPVNVDNHAGSAGVSLTGSTADTLFGSEGNTILSVPSISGVSSYTLGMPASVLSGGGTENTLTFATEVGNITIPGSMLSGLAGTSGKEAGITISEGDKSGLPGDVREALGNRPILQLTFALNGEQTEWNNPDAPVTVTIPYSPTAEELQDPEHIVIWYIDGTGNAVSVPSGRFDPATGTVTFSTTHFSDYAIAYVHKTFADLNSAYWAKKAIEVMASKGIINGTGKDTCSPKACITRADYMVMLIKSLGLTADFKNNFADVKSGTYYYESLGIAKELGIATGSGDDQFRPKEKISRQDMMVLAARALEKSEKLKMGSNSDVLEQFSDKDHIAGYAAESLAALIQNELITGSGNKLNPLGDTTRAEAAVFLYRIYNQ